MLVSPCLLPAARLRKRQISGAEGRVRACPATGSRVEPVTRASQLVMFDLPGSRLTLHEADSFNQPGPTGTVPYWTVSDVDATVAQWSEHGATPHRGPKTIMTGERLCQLLDPFGNLFG